MATLGNDIWKAWDRHGKTDFMKHIKMLIKHSDDNASPLFEDSTTNLDLTKAIHEMIRRGLQGSIRREAAVAMIADLVELHEDMAAILTDVLGVLDAETSCTEGKEEERQLFCLIMKDSERHLSEKLFKERLEIETLQEVGTLKDRNFYTKFIKVKTKLYYKQRKFNLLREESEGYAKLITELGQDIGAHITPQFILEVIKALIGCFNLDPNRVLDIILESFECRPEQDEFFIPLIRSYMADPKILSEVLGFKFRLYHPTSVCADGSSSAVTPESLYTVTAIMLKHGIIRLEDIYCWLVPEDNVIHGEWEKEMRDAKEYVRKLNIISTKEKEELTEESEPPVDKYEENQKFGLGEAMLRVGAWTQFQQLSRKMPDNCLLTQAPVARALCELLHILIEPVYRANLGVLQGVIDKPTNPPKPPHLAPSQVTSFIGLRDTVIPMLVALGPSLHLDPILMYKIIRISKAALIQASGGVPLPINPPSGDSMYFDVLTILDDVLLPSLSHMESNCSVSEEMWSLLKFYPYQFRYCIYIRWKNESHQKHAALTKKRGDVLKNIKSLMKRVSKENVKPVGRLIGKLTHSSPGFLFDYVLMQIQIYDNLIGPVVDSLKYLTSLSYDVLGCCLVEALSQADKNRFKHDGTSISLWLQSLASFCGAVFKKYTIELGGILQYVANQLKAQKSLDLLILKEIVHKMAGVEAAEELTTEQLDAMSGGELLRAEAGYFSQARNTKKSSNRLKEALTEQNLAVSLCLLMAQQRYCVEYRETENSHLKLVGKLYDQCQDTLVQFGTFLASSLTVEEYIGRLPTVNNMLAKFHIHADVAFFLARPMFTHAINNKCEALRRADPKGKNLTVEQRHEKYIEACNIILGPIVESVRPLHAPKIWEDISPQFLVTFWSLTTYDLYVPEKSYQNEISKLKQMATQAMENKDGVTGKGKKEQEKLTALIDKLQDERKKQTEHVEKVMARLKKEKDSWFLSRSAKSAKNETITQFLQLCLFPRCIFTAPDAVYCAKFVQTIHSLKTANFSTLLCYDRLFCDITYTVTACTENEANRYGRFLCAMLDTVMHWHRKKETFDEECANFPGFVTKFRVSNQFSDANDHVGYENYRHVVHKWHYKITKALVVCLDSKDYVHIRNSLIILIKILPHFPVLMKLISIIERKVEKVREQEKDKRQDLFILATSYFGQLKAKSSKAIEENDFHQMSDKSSAGRTTESTKQNGGSQQSGNHINQTASNIPITEVNGDLAKGMDPPAEKRSSDSANKTSSASKRDSTGKDRVDRPRDTESSKVQRRDDSERSSRTKERRDERVYRDGQSPPSTEKWERGTRDERHDEGRYYDAPRSSQYRSSSLSLQDLELEHSSNSSPTNSMQRLSQEPPDSERDSKRRKLEGSSKRQEDGKGEEKKERSSKSKPRSTDEEREMRKERKLSRKRDRADEAQQLASSSSSSADQKRRKEEEKAAKSLGHQNGEPIDHNRDKHRYSREKSPYLRDRERERSHDRDKQSNDSKRR